MDLPPLQTGRLVRRVNRFVALVSLGGVETEVHIANTGRLRELLVPGAECYLTPQSAPHRRTGYDLTLVAVPVSSDQALQKPRAPYASPERKTLVVADTRLPNAVVWEAWERGWLPGFEGYDAGRREVTFEDSRMDLLLEGTPGRCLIEVKSVTLVLRGEELVEGNVGLFPDSPTERGRRHVATLARAVGQGYRAAVLFVVQRDDAVACAPNDATDPAFGAALRAAVSAGVEAHAFTCRVTPREVRLLDPIPVRL
jgi:sugar fermentation stimulation protein A